MAFPETALLVPNRRVLFSLPFGEDTFAIFRLKVPFPE